MEISFRLNKIAEKVEKGSILADIGTDHAYVPIFLYKNGIIKNAIACDISEGSLEKAKINISKYNLENFIETRLGSGLEKIYLDDNINTIIIAGMGGMLMIDILKNGMEIAKNTETLILQPQKDVSEVRKFLHKNGFKIEDEEMLIDEEKFYNIIIAKKGNQSFNEKEYIFGKSNIDKKCVILKEYILKELNIMKNIIKKLEKTNSFNRIKEIKKQENLYKEVLECL